MLRMSLLALTVSLALGSMAQAQEVISNDANRANPPAPVTAAQADADQTDAAANGAWARAVMDKAAQDKTGSKQASCLRNPDRDAHGEVWAGAGSNGYRDYGVVATKPVGDCSSITVGFEQGSGDYGYGRRGR